MQRSGWDRDARFLIFDCGPLGDGGHGHYDLLSVEAHARGRPLVVDPGAAATPRRRRTCAAGSAARPRTTPSCVDGLDQTPYTRGRPRGAVGRGPAARPRTRAGLDVLAGEARSPAYEAVHERRIAFVGDRYWIDRGPRCAGEREHRYDLRFHLAPGARAGRGRRRARARRWRS